KILWYLILQPFYGPVLATVCCTGSEGPWHRYRPAGGMNMRFSGLFAVALGLTVVAAIPQAVSAQGKGEGPAFCRNGQGHPKFGREWCVDHGFPLGNEWT